MPHCHNSAYFPSPVHLLICSSTLQDLFGTQIPRSQVIYDYIHNIALAVPSIHWQTLLTGVAALVRLAGCSVYLVYMFVCKKRR